MNKISKKQKVKLRQWRKQKKINKRRKRQNKHSKRVKVKKYNKYEVSDSVKAPKDFRFIENTEECLSFFRKLRNGFSMQHWSNKRFRVISLKDITKIDYAAISLLTAVSDVLKFKNIILRGDFPDDYDCRKFMVDSGFVDRMFKVNGERFNKKQRSGFIFFEKGTGKLSEKDNKRISSLLKDIVLHLTGGRNNYQPMKTALLEICGNSIEHADSENRQWLLGAKFDKDKVVLTVTDVGKGILETLHRKFSTKFKDLFSRKTNLDILFGAFQKKYGSSTQEANRNKGLPSVMSHFENGIIMELKVVTNDVLLDFEDTHSKIFQNQKNQFNGTLYQWVLTKDCIK